MSGAEFVICVGCGRLMLGQVAADGTVYPQPHICPDKSELRLANPNDTVVTFGGSRHAQTQAASLIPGGAQCRQ